MSETGQLNLKIGTRVILPADDELGVQAQRATYLGNGVFRILTVDRDPDDYDGLVETDPADPRIEVIS